MNLAAIDWPTVILVGSIGLLASGLILRFGMPHANTTAKSPAPERHGIDQYRPQVYH